MTINLEWREISDVKHCLVGAKGKLQKHGFTEDADYAQGLVDRIQEIIDRHIKDPNNGGGEHE